MIFKRWIVASGLTAYMLTEPAMAGKFSEAEAAYKRKDMVTAYQIWHSLAEEGDADSQFTLGWKCLTGKIYDSVAGRQCDSTEGVFWMRTAAEHWHVPAMMEMTSLCFSGIGVPEDYAQAHMWANLAASTGGREALKLRRDLEKLLSAEQIAEGQRLAREWLIAHPRL